MKKAKLIVAVLSLLTLSTGGCRTSGSKLKSDDVQTDDETKQNAPKKVSAEILLDFL